MTPPENGAVLRLAYADPPYPGWCHKYGHEHGDGGPMPWDGRCWDELDTHRALIDHLAASYDGWGYSTISPALVGILPMVPTGTRVAAWVKPFASFKPNQRIAYAWEPVLFQPARKDPEEGVPYGRDFLAESITLRRGFTGSKPERFCRWVLDLLGYVEGDEFTDLFPGSGSMGRALAAGVLL